MKSDEMNTRGGNPFRCYGGGFLVRALVVSVLVIALGLLVRWMGWEKGSLQRTIVLVTQAALVAYIIVITVYSIRRLDELQQRVHLEAIAFSFAATGVIVTAWGLLTKAGLPDVPWGAWTWVMMTFFWFIGVVFTKRRYQ